VKIEHLALNVTDPVAMAAWYVEHLGMSVARKIDEASHAHFLADDGGTVMLEVYTNPPDEIPDYAAMNPLHLHVAFVSDDSKTDRGALEQAGATFVEEINTDNGDCIIMMRDPWGLAIQLCQRAAPMLG
jgi:catechol 2,3-dioxygenase-like lactoylglutathione lyase family enzyme